MCNKQNISQLLSSNLYAKMHTPTIRSLTPPNTSTIEDNNNNYNYNNNKEYTTTICTQCKQVLEPYAKSTPISIPSKNDDQFGITRSSTSLSHGLCRNCFNNINTNLLSTAYENNNYNNNENNKNDNYEKRRQTLLSKSLSSPQLSRHLPSRPKRVLIVDDNKFQRQIHKRMIEQAGYECDVAVSGLQAIELVQKHSYHYILMDLIMSPMDGWTTTKKIKSILFQILGFTSSTPKIIAVTGLHVDEKLKLQCADSGMDDVLQKPISPSHLSRILHKQSSSKLDR